MATGRDNDDHGTIGLPKWPSVDGRHDGEAALAIGESGTRGRWGHVLTRLGLLCLAAVLTALTWIAPAHAADSFALLDAQRGLRAVSTGQSYTDEAVLWYTANGGDTWRRLATKPIAYDTWRGHHGGLLSFASPRAGLWLRESRRPAVLRTTDGGVSWKKAALTFPANSSQIIWDVACASATIAWACTGDSSEGDGGSILRSTNGGATWRTLKSLKTRPGEPPAGAFMEISCPTAKACFVLGQGERLAGLWASSDGGAHWAKRKLPGGWAVALNFPAASTGWVIRAGGSAIHRTTNAGRSWQKQYSGTDDLLALDSVSRQRGWAVGRDGVVLRTGDGGVTWERFTVPMDVSLDEVGFADALHGWVAGGNWSTGSGERVFFRTSDGGETWERF